MFKLEENLNIINEEDENYLFHRAYTFRVDKEWNTELIIREDEPYQNTSLEEENVVIKTFGSRLKLIFTAELPPSPQGVHQELLMATEERRYF